MSNFIELTDYATDQKITVAIDSIRTLKIHPKGEGTTIYFKGIPDSQEARMVKEDYRDISHNLMAAT